MNTTKKCTCKYPIIRGYEPDQYCGDCGGDLDGDGGKGKTREAAGKSLSKLHLESQESGRWLSNDEQSGSAIIAIFND